MSGLDSFFGAEGADGGLSAEQVREFQARMTRNSQLMAAARKQEKKQKKKEQDLVAILLWFIQHSTKAELTLLISRCLEQNIPAVFILAIILLGNEDIQKRTGMYLQLEAPEEGSVEEPLQALPAPPEGVNFKDLEDEAVVNALITLGDNQAFPLELRVTLDLWGKNIFEAASPIPERILKTAAEFNEDSEANPEPKPAVSQLAAFVLRDYFDSKTHLENFENIKNFVEFFLKAILLRLKDQVRDQKQLN